MTDRSHRLDASLEGALRGPERLVLAMPLFAVVGLAGVLSAAALSQSVWIVALLAVAGLGVSAIAPMALLEIYVGRPLRAAIAHLRAVRDGAEPPAAAPPTGVIGDLVALARDIRAGQSHLGQFRDTLTQWEQIAAAGDEAIRAFRLQTEELAETTVQSESQLRKSAQGQFAEISEALKALNNAAPTAPLDAGLERIEQMLVYLAESLERREASDKDGSGERVEQALTDIVRLIGRETQSLRESVTAAALTVRNDIAGAVASDNAVRGREIERLETRVLAKLDDIAAPDGAALTGAIRAEAEITRRELREQVEQTRVTQGATGDREELRGLAEAIARLSEASAGADAAALREDLQKVAAALSEAIAGLPAKMTGETSSGGVADIGERLREQTLAQASRLDEIESRVARHAVELGREEREKALATLARTTEKLRNAIDRLDAVATAAANAGTAHAEGLRETLRELESEIAAFGARLEGGLDFTGLRADLATLGERVEATGQAQAQQLGEHFAAFEGGPIEALRAAVSAIATQQEGAQAGAETLLALRTAVDTVKARVAEVAPRVAALCEGLARGLDDRLASFEATSLQPAARDLAHALCFAAEREDRDFAALRAAVEGVEAAVLRAPGELAQSFSERFDAFAGDQAQRAEALEMRLAGQAVAHDRTEVASALTVFRTMTRDLADARARFDAAVATRGASDVTDDLGARFDAFAAAQSERLLALDLRLSARAAGLDRTSVAAGLTVFRHMTRNLSDALERLQIAAAAIEEHRAQVVAAREADDALRDDLGAIGEAVSGAAARLDDFARAQAQRLEALELRLVGNSRTLDRTAVAAALTVFRNLTREMTEALAGLRPSGEAASDAGADLGAISEAVANAATRFEGRLDAFAADLADRLIALETRVSGRNLAVNRNAAASALVVFRTLAHDFSQTVARFDAATGLIEQRAAALDGQAGGEPLQELAAAVAGNGQRLDAFAASQNERLEALELRLAARGVSLERTAVATALVAFRGLGRTLKGAVGRFEAATEAVRARTLDPADAPEWRGDLSALAGELAEIGGRLDAFVTTQSDGLAGLAGRLANGEPQQTQLTEAVAALGEIAAKFEAGATPPAAVDLSGLQTLEGRLAQTLSVWESRAAAPRPAPEFVTATDPRSSGAIARIVMSLADSLDFRFVQIEQGLEDLFNKLQAATARRDNAGLSAGMTDLAKQVQSASEVLKVGLSDFVGVSAALVEDIDARNRNSQDVAVLKLR